MEDILLKKLIYQSLHRGCKEMDIILGNFTPFLPNLSHEMLNLYANLLEEADWNIYAWVMYNNEVPEQYKELIMLIVQKQEIVG